MHTHTELCTLNILDYCICWINMFPVCVASMYWLVAGPCLFLLNTKTTITRSFVLNLGTPKAMSFHMFSYCKYADDQLMGHMFLWVNPCISVIATCFWCSGTICLSIDLSVHFRGNPQVWDVENQSVLVATRSDCERLVCLVFTVSFWVNDGCTNHYQPFS